MATTISGAASEGADDVYYVCYTPRIPKPGTQVTLVLSKDELPAKDFPDDDGPDDMSENGAEEPSDDGGSGK